MNLIPLSLKTSGVSLTTGLVTAGRVQAMVPGWGPQRPVVPMMRTLGEVREQEVPARRKLRRAAGPEDPCISANGHVRGSNHMRP